MTRSDLEELWANKEYDSIASSIDVMQDYVWQNLLSDAHSLSDEDLKCALITDFEMSEEELE